MVTIFNISSNIIVQIGRRSIFWMVFLSKVEVEFHGKGKILSYTLNYYKYNGTEVEKAK